MNVIEGKRILGYMKARELSAEEIQKVSGGLMADTSTKITTGNGDGTSSTHTDTVCGD